MADYGDAGINGVAGLTKPYTNGSAPSIYDTATNPTLSQVENWLVEISAELNIQLGNAYFDTPITALAVIPAITNFANKEVVKMIEQEVRNRSAIGPTGDTSSSDSFALTENVGKFVKDNARGFQSNGANRQSQFVLKAFG